MLETELNYAFNKMILVLLLSKLHKKENLMIAKTY